MPRPALIVDPHQHFATYLANVAVCEGLPAIVADSFAEARANLDAELGVLVTSLKLGEYNGIHLVHLARQYNPGVVCIVFGEDDHRLGFEVQRAGAFYEWRESVAFALPRYVAALGTLPVTDRRNPEVSDRRVTFRGGRRVTDVELLFGLRRPPPSSPSVSLQH